MPIPNISGFEKEIDYLVASIEAERPTKDEDLTRIGAVVRNTESSYENFYAELKQPSKMSELEPPNMLNEI